MKVLILAFVVTAAVVAEPPVPSNRYLPASFSSSRRISSVSTRYGAPFSRSGNGNGNGHVNGISSLSSQYSAPSLQYGAPSIAYSAPSPQYGVPSSRYGTPGYDRSYDDQSEPANYNFQYDVQEDNDFGHAEARQGDDAKGKYYVLLPDGRKQIVEYTATAEGYKPRISYEQTSNGYAGRNGYGNGGYSNGGYSNGGYSNGNNGNYDQNSGNGGYQY